MSVKLTEDEYIRRLRGSPVVYKSGFAGRNQICLHSFLSCGHDFERKPASILESLKLGNIVCKICRTGIRKSEHIRKIGESKIAAIRDCLKAYHPHIELVNYTTSKQPITLFCTRHRCEFRVTKKIVKNCFIGCQQCLLDQKTAHYKQWVEEVSKGSIKYVSGYFTDETPCVHFCEIHGKRFSKPPHKLKSHYREYGCIGCDECNAEFKSNFIHQMRTKVGEVAISVFKRKCEGIVSIETPITFARELNVIGRFIKCGHRVSKSYQQWRHSLPYVSQYYSGCPVCEGRSGERIVYMICQEEMPDAISQYSFFDDSENWPISVDVYSPSRKVIVEADGAQHKHAVFGKQTFERTRRRDLVRERICAEKGIQLIRIDTDALFPIFKHIEEIRQVIRKKLATFSTSETIHGK